MKPLSSPPPIHIRHDVSLLFWLLFRPMALRNYVRDIHKDLDQKLLVWKVREDVECNTHFQALCRARRWLLTADTWLVVMIFGYICTLFTVDSNSAQLLTSATAYSAAVLVSDKMRWWSKPGNTNRVSLSFLVVVGVVQFALAYILLLLIRMRDTLDIDALRTVLEMSDYISVMNYSFFIGLLVDYFYDLGPLGVMLVGPALCTLLPMMLECQCIEQITGPDEFISLFRPFGLLLGGVGGLILSSYLPVLADEFLDEIAEKMTPSKDDWDNEGVAIRSMLAVVIVVSILVIVIVSILLGLAMGVVPIISRMARAYSNITVMQGIETAIEVGKAFGIACIIAYLILCFRLPIYLGWQLPRCLHLSYRAKQSPAQAVALWFKQPLHFDEVILLPLINLPTHLLFIASVDAIAFQQALADVDKSFSQKWSLRRTLSLLLKERVPSPDVLDSIAHLQDRRGRGTIS